MQPKNKSKIKNNSSMKGKKMFPKMKTGLLSTNNTIKTYIDRKLSQLTILSVGNSPNKNNLSHNIFLKSITPKVIANKSNSSTAISVFNDDKEQIREIDKLKEENDKLKSQIEIAKRRIADLENLINKFISGDSKDNKYKCPHPMPYVKKYGDK